MNEGDAHDSLAKFYTSLLRQNPKSEMAIRWCLKNGFVKHIEAFADSRVKKIAENTMPHNKKKNVKKESKEKINLSHVKKDKGKNGKTSTKRDNKNKIKDMNKKDKEKEKEKKEKDKKKKKQQQKEQQNRLIQKKKEKVMANNIKKIGTSLKNLRI